MSDEKHESILGIASEMLKFAGADSQSIGSVMLRIHIQRFARRIEKTATECSKPGNSVVEAAETVRKSACGGDAVESQSKASNVPRSAIDGEKPKTIRNCDRFATADDAAEAYDDFRKMCDKVSCSDCRFCNRGIPCVLSWLYEEAEKEI